MVQEAEIKERIFNAENINQHLNDIYEQFLIYDETIQPLIVSIEELKGEFPAEILNEVRAMYTHLCRAFTSENEQDIVSNIEKIKRHTKRALLDCYKNSCIVVLDRRKFFFEKFKGVDLSLISNGNFLSQESIAYQEAVDTLKFAKKSESSNTDTDTLFELYEKAYNKALVLDSLISNAEDTAAFLKHKAIKRDILAYVFGVVGIIGTIFTVVSYFQT